MGVSLTYYNILHDSNDHGEWSPYIIYSIGDIVSRMGSYYQSASDSNKGSDPINSKNWINIS